MTIGTVFILAGFFIIVSINIKLMKKNKRY